MHLPKVDFPPLRLSRQEGQTVCHGEVDSSDADGVAATFSTLKLRDRQLPMTDDDMRRVVRSLEDRQTKTELWQAEHDGRINAYWESQRQWNAVHSSRQTTTERRVGVVEKRLIWICALAAMGGGVLGNLLPGVV